MDSIHIIQEAHTIMTNLGAGYSESCYQNALFNAIAKVDPSVQKELTIPVIYDDQLIGTCRADIVTNQHVIEVKATRAMPSQVCNQIRKYLVNMHKQDQTTRSGIILNFNQDVERVEVIVLSADAGVTTVKKKREAHSTYSAPEPI